MICLGKSYWNAQRQDNENKENLDQNIARPKLADKPPAKPLLLKKTSDQPTACSSEPELDAFSETLKHLYSEQISLDYSCEIMSHFRNSDPNLGSFLSYHSVTPTLRAKMVDWMIEVLSSYKMSEDTFFRSVGLMDQYFKSEDRLLETKDIHLVGVAAMFSAMKYEEIHPLRLSLIAEKIARKKFTKQEIVDKESRMMQVLGFSLGSSSILDIVKLLDHEIKLQLKPSYREYLTKILIYLAKMCTFNHELICQDSTVVAAAVYFIALKTLEQVMKELVPQKMLFGIGALVGLDEEAILGAGREVLQLAKTFSKMYPNLNNLKRFNRFEYRDE